MKRNIITLVICIGCALNIMAQQRERFSLDIPATYPIVTNSLYKTISFMDNRLNKTRNQYIVNPELFSRQLSSFVDQATDHTAQSRTLLFQLRDLSFEASDNKGFSHIRASLYEVSNSQYYVIGTLDTEVQVQNNKNMADRLQREVSAAIISFVGKSLDQNVIDNTPYTLDDIRHIDSVEKESSQLYKNDTYRDGIYYSFESFRAQQPTVTKMEVRFKKNKLSEIKLVDQSTNKSKKLEPASIYAIVLDGQAYITFDNKYYPLYLDNGNLLFDTEHNSSNIGFAPSFSVGIGSGGYRGGGIGLGVFTRTKKETATYMIDHLNGRFTQVN